MGKLHVHKRLTSEAAKEILSRYDRGELDLTAARSQLGVRRSRFFDYLKEYRTDSEHFSVAITDSGGRTATASRTVQETRAPLTGSNGGLCPQ
jgi:hypothetical protein